MINASPVNHVILIEWLIARSSGLEKAWAKITESTIYQKLKFKSEHSKFTPMTWLCREFLGKHFWKRKPNYLYENFKKSISHFFAVNYD